MPPRFGHHNLLTTTSGEGLSKRMGSLSLGSLRQSGIEPLAVAALAVLVGSAQAVRPVESLDELAGLVELSKLSRAPARFDEAELESLNAKLLHHLPYAAVAERLAALGVSGGEAFWLAVRGNLARFADAADWWVVVSGPVEPVVEDAGFLAEAAALLPPEPWDHDDVGHLDRARQAGDRPQGQGPFHAAEAGADGLDHGPELKALLPLIGPAQAKARLAP